MLYNSPVGFIKIKVSDGFVNELMYVDDENSQLTEILKPSLADKTILQKCICQLDEYFYGKRKTFDLPFIQSGTEFQQKVWKLLSAIPFGKTITYLHLAQQLGDIKSIRAAASANGKNKLNIVIPCHRVIGTDGNLVGYGGGLPRKRWLLNHENKYANGVTFLFE